MVKLNVLILPVLLLLMWSSENFKLYVTDILLLLDNTGL